MRINPGGILDTRDVVGRDNEIARLWRVLERQSLVIAPARRSGKTRIVRKMQDERRDGCVSLYQDLEKTLLIVVLVLSVFDAMQQPADSSRKRRARFAKWRELVVDRIVDALLPQADCVWRVLLARAVDAFIGERMMMR